MIEMIDRTTGSLDDGNGSPKLLVSQSKVALIFGAADTGKSTMVDIGEHLPQMCGVDD